MRFPLTLTIISQDTNFDFIGNRWIAFMMSLIISAAMIALLFIKGLNFGIDFTGGMIFEVKAPQKIVVADLRQQLSNRGYKGATLQGFADESIVMIRLQLKEQEKSQGEMHAFEQVLYEVLGENIEFRKKDYVGARLGGELVKNGIIALLLALLAMAIYISVRFNWQYAIAGIIALLHDLLFTIGFYAVTRLEFDVTSILALLTVIGYSINDSVVIFDRIRENLRKYKVKNLSDLINGSINETLSRTIMTVLTTIIACLALVLFGGEVIFGFSIAIMIGIAFGTYSSIFISAPILLYANINKK